MENHRYYIRIMSQTSFDSLLKSLLVVLSLCVHNNSVVLSTYTILDVNFYHILIDYYVCSHAMDWILDLVRILSYELLPFTNMNV